MQGLHQGRELELGLVESQELGLELGLHREPGLVLHPGPEPEPEPEPERELGRPRGQVLRRGLGRPRLGQAN